MITLKASYGRKYPDANAALIAWAKGKDFQIINGPYCSIRDLDLMKGQFNGIQIRYGEFGSYRYAVVWQSLMSQMLISTEI